MRQIILDTETTGIDPRAGNRIIEIGCVEMLNRQLTGNNFHYYINPERDSEEGALAVHGLTTEFLSDKPKFAEIANEFRDYIAGAEIIIHNAPFDVGFLNAEFERLGAPRFEEQIAGIIDTLVMAKSMYPGKRNSLDALCDRYGISNAHRTLHGALLDSELLAEVYLAMTRGQESLTIDLSEPVIQNAGSAAGTALPLAEILVLPATAEELAEHEALLDKLDKEAKGTCVWRTVSAIPAQ
ncbi:MAG TPA: DNA polymerase III subunit epsilon [Paucimonas sp.]|nr:DNA polymerase III subunit epsilon [Paucimonas sp.]